MPQATTIRKKHPEYFRYLSMAFSKSLADLTGGAAPA